MTELYGTDMPAEASHSTPTPYRRNGKLFSCEPCRKGKLRCDHAGPVCGRCSRRGKPDQCVYHPAPLTKGHAPSSPGSHRPSISSSMQSVSRCSPYSTSKAQALQGGLASPPSSLGTGPLRHPSTRPSIRPSPVEALASRGSVGATSAMPVDFSTSRASRLPSTATSESLPPRESPMSFQDSRHGFLGPTAYSAVYTENPGSLSIAEPDVATSTDDPSYLPALSAEKIQEGANILAMLKDLPLYRRLTQRRFDLYGGIIVPRPVFQIWVDDLWAEFGPVLSDCDPDQLLRLSEMVFRNTRRPFKTHGRMNATDWAKAASGRNVRWEVIGIVISLVGLVAVNLDDWDSIFDDVRDKIIDRATFGERMGKASGHCLCFCYECEAFNDIYACFMYIDVVLVECLKGEAHYAAWQRTGELLDAVVAMGLHQGNNVDAQTSFFVAQLRKWLFASAFSRDKVVASFLGRPPRLSYRYCKLEVPLDLTDEELCDDGADLDTSLARLDANGWNTNGELGRRTWTRVWFQECVVREEILELALGSGDENIEQRAEEIRLKLERLRASFPDCMKVEPDAALSLDINACGGAYGVKKERVVRQFNAVYIIFIVAGTILTDFLLQRALVNRSKRDTQSLIPISRKMLKTVLVALSWKELFRDFQGDMIYLLAEYGLPSAGVLAVELLKQEQTRQYTPDILPRSETKQDLSVFISALGNVAPGEANFNICNQGRRALKRVLDQILSPSVPAATSNPVDSTFGDISLFFPTGNDADFLQWLDTAEWDKGLINPGSSSGVP